MSESKEQSMLVRFAIEEFEYLAKETPDAVVLELKDHIIAMVEAVAEMGNSGGSHGFVVSAINETLRRVLSFKPLTDLTGADEEWIQVAEDTGGAIYQNRRAFGVFKQGATAWYTDAVVFKGRNGAFTGNNSVFTLANQMLPSKLVIKQFPFKPKTFYIDVMEGKQHSVVKDSKQLEEVWKVYKKPKGFDIIRK